DEIRITCYHPRFLRHSLDISSLNAYERTNLRIVLRSGRTVSGKIVDQAGMPVEAALVEANVDDDWLARKAIQSAADGQFKLSGLPEKQTALRVHAVALRQNAEKPIRLDRDIKDLVIQLKPIELTETPDAIELFGLKLATLTPDLRRAYLLE